MLTRTTCLTALLAGALPLLGAAQTVAPTTTPEVAPRFYVGLGGSLLAHGRLAGFDTDHLAPTLTAGVYLRPRLALQISASYWQDTRHNSFAGRQADGNGQSQTGVWSTVRVDRYLNVPILLRYTLISKPSSRLAVDLLGGVSLRRYSNSYNELFTFDQTQETLPSIFDGTSSYTSAYLTLGPSLRYNLTPHVDLTADFVFDYYLNKSYGAFYDNLSGNLMLGARYRFGGR